MSNRPNILFFMMDQLAPQVLGPYGGRQCRTPAIDELAETGVVFENAYCNSPLCAGCRSQIDDATDRKGSWRRARGNTYARPEPVRNVQLAMVRRRSKTAG